MAQAGLEQQLAASKFELLVNSVTDYAIYMLDPEGRIGTWNAGAERFKGYSADEIIGEHVSRFFTPEDKAADLPGHALRTAAREGRFEAEGWRIRKDGSRFFVHAIIDAIHDDRGQLIGFAKITRDITEQRQRKEALRASEQRFQILVNAVEDYAIYMLDPSGIVTNWNTGAQTIKGYTAQEIVGQHFSRFYRPEDRAAGVPQLALATALREGKFEAEAQRVRKDGTPFWAHVLIDPIHDEAGEHLGFAKITRDITERKLAEETLRQTQEALLQSQKLQALGELAGGIAHDFNNLLTVVRGTADLLLRREDLPAERRNRYLNAVLETVDRAESLTSQLLAFARRQPFEPEVIDLGARVDALSEMLLRTLGSRYELRLDLAPALWRVEVDPTGLETALLNAVLNARDAMPEGGSLTLSTRNLSDGAAPMVQLAITDAGSGIPPEQVPRAFEPFFTTKPTGKGTGLGLSQIHGFAAQSGGSARIESEPGRGTSLILTLPRSDKPLPEGTSIRRLLDLPKGLRVLLVEDSPQVRQFASQLLADLGCKVMTAVDGQEALDLVAKSLPDLVFSDIVMPGMTGVELAQHLRVRHPELPILLASGFSSEHCVAEDQRAFPILRKPYKLETMAASIDRLIRRPNAAF